MNIKFKSLIAGLLCLASTEAFALAGATGSYCDRDANIVESYQCNFQPGPDWVRSPDGCFHKRGPKTCTAITSTNPVFDPNTYGVLNPDVANAGIDRLSHWQNNGQAEGRSGSFLYDPRGYLNSNGDVGATFGTNWSLILKHYLEYGVYEGRSTLYAGTPDLPWPVYVGVNPPKDGSYNFVVWRLGTEANPNLDTHLNTSDITGLPNAWTRGPQIQGPQAQTLISTLWGFTGVQKYGDEFGIGIDSRAVMDTANYYSRINKAANPSQVYNILPVVLGRQLDDVFKPKSWVPGQNGVITSMTLRIPFAGGTNGGGSQIVSYLQLRDTTTGQELFIGAVFFDTRADQDVPIRIGRDACGVGCSGNTIASVSLKQYSAYISVPIYGAQFTSTPFPETRAYEYRINPWNLQNILNEIPGRTMSGNPADYELLSWGLNPEVFTPIDGAGNMTGDGWVAFSGKINATIAP
jgi:hypothetical protein